MRSLFAAFWRDQRGATALEYALIAGVTTVLIAAAVQAIGGSINTLFNRPLTQGLS